MLEDEIVNLRNLKSTGLALVEFAQSLFPGTAFEQNGRRWVARPNNFVTFEVHWRRSRNISLSLRGKPDEFLLSECLPLRAGMGGYSECKVTNVRQLAAAAAYIETAAEIFTRGRARVRKQPRLVT